MAGQLLKPMFRIVLEDDGPGIRLWTHDADAVELLWNQVLGPDFVALRTIDQLLGSGI